MNEKSFGAVTASRFGFLDGYGFLRSKVTKSQVAILLYHRVNPQKDNWSLEPISLKSFKMQIEYFCKNYEILPLEKVTAIIRQKKTLPSKAVAITFDDGYKDNYIYAYPILKKSNIPATIFITTGNITTGEMFWWDKVNYIIYHSSRNQLQLEELDDYSTQSDLEKNNASLAIVKRLAKLQGEQRQYLVKKLLKNHGGDISTNLGKELLLSWDEVKEMSSNGIDFGSHTVSHLVLPDSPEEQIRWEIVRSKKDIEEKIKKKVVGFSYPHGHFNNRIIKLIQESGYSCAVSVFPSKLVSSKDNIYKLSRIEASEDFDKNKIFFCGLGGDLHQIGLSNY
jgi:peptidoglycan/xylan/chitin deacetylase (PgdA/CDA1 family)